jgi:hypothetical protein
MTWALGQPGPPQLNSTLPIRRLRSVARRRVRANVTWEACGRDQSTGARNVAHWTPGAPPQVFHRNVDGVAAAAVGAVNKMATATTASTRSARIHGELADDAAALVLMLPSRMSLLVVTREQAAGDAISCATDPARSRSPGRSSERFWGAEWENGL